MNEERCVDGEFDIFTFITPSKLSVFKHERLINAISSSLKSTIIHQTFSLRSTTLESVKHLLFLCNYRAETHLALMFTPCVSPSDSTHTHPSILCRWCSQSKSMCVSVAVVAYVYSRESWRSEANRWAASSECCEITECVALLTAPDGQREPSLSVFFFMKMIQGLTFWHRQEVWRELTL